MFVKNLLKKVIFCNYDVVVFGMMNVFYELGIVIGEDI